MHILCYVYKTTFENIETFQKSTDGETCLNRHRDFKTGQPSTVPFLDRQPSTVPFLDRQPSTVPFLDRQPSTVPFLDKCGPKSPGFKGNLCIMSNYGNLCIMSVSMDTCVQC